jgi:hypothetical protein
MLKFGVSLTDDTTIIIYDPTRLETLSLAPL